MTKPDKIDLILQLIMDICIFGIIKTLSFDLGKILGVAFDTCFLATLSGFWGKNKALVWLYLHSWTWFDVPIILGVKFWWFSFFFGSCIAHLEPELQRFEDRSPFVGISATRTGFGYQRLCVWNIDRSSNRDMAVWSWFPCAIKFYIVIFRLCSSALYSAWYLT